MLVFHEGRNNHEQDAAYSWSPESIFPQGGEEQRSPGIYDPPGKERQLGAVGLAYRLDDELEPQLQDGNLTAHAVKTIQGLASGKFGEDVAAGTRPFFLAVGLHKPQ